MESDAVFPCWRAGTARTGGTRDDVKCTDPASAGPAGSRRTEARKAPVAAHPQLPFHGPVQVTGLLLPALGLFGGVIGLYLGAHWLVFGAAGLGRTLGARPIVIGLTVVSLGTSAPELVVCVLAAVGGSSDLAIGNALGSNLANIGLILGVTAIVQPLGVNRRMVVREIPAMLLITLLVYPLIMDHDVSRPDGAILLMVLVFYLGALLKSARRETPAMLKEFEAHSDEIEAMPKSLAKNILLVLLGSALLVLGGRIIVVSAIHIATGLGISELLIGGTVVAIGTSLPELATTVVAATRNEADIAVGNVIGSNIFNLTAVLGAAAVVEPLSVASGVLDREFLAVVVLSVLVWPVAWTGLKVRRWEGLLLLMVYAILWLWLGQS